MGKARSLEELKVYKRELQAELEFQRRELASCVGDVATSFRSACSGITQLASNRFLLMGLVASLGFLIFSKKTKPFRKPIGLIASILVPRVRGFIASQAVKFAMKGIQYFRKPASPQPDSNTSKA